MSGGDAELLNTVLVVAVVGAVGVGVWWVIWGPGAVDALKADFRSVRDTLAGWWTGTIITSDDSGHVNITDPNYRPPPPATPAQKKTAYTKAGEPTNLTTIAEFWNWLVGQDPSLATKYKGVNSHDVQLEWEKYQKDVKEINEEG